MWCSVNLVFLDVDVRWLWRDEDNKMLSIYYLDILIKIDVDWTACLLAWNLVSPKELTIKPCAIY